MEGRLAHIEPALGEVVDIGSGVRADHAGRDPLLAGARAGDDHAVAAAFGRYAVGRHQRLGVREVGVDVDHRDPAIQARVAPQAVERGRRQEVRVVQWGKGVGATGEGGQRHTAEPISEGTMGGCVAFSLSCSLSPSLSSACR
ncbi:hypothetical protein [Nostocoides veronense]|uniref:hypothetical protein n=1 Tax=Nostocoides veronense TaxID=330836 RepID=UPI003CD0BDA8